MKYILIFITLFFNGCTVYDDVLTDKMFFKIVNESGNEIRNVKIVGETRLNQFGKQNIFFETGKIPSGTVLNYSLNLKKDTDDVYDLYFYEYKNNNIDYSRILTFTSIFKDYSEKRFKTDICTNEITLKFTTDTTKVFWK